MDINILPPDVDRVAQAVGDAVKTAKDQVTKALTPSTAAANANRGWQCSPALADCATVWQDHLTDLIRQTEDAAQNLHDSADYYREVENRIAHALTDLHS
ncbi:MAG: hypothetical protein ACRDRS_18270 [Pseudonocardiaceae bacterium]